EDLAAGGPLGFPRLLGRLGHSAAALRVAGAVVASELCLAARGGAHLPGAGSRCGGGCLGGGGRKRAPALGHTQPAAADAFAPGGGADAGAVVCVARAGFVPPTAGGLAGASKSQRRPLLPVDGQSAETGAREVRAQMLAAAWGRGAPRVPWRQGPTPPLPPARGLRGGSEFGALPALSCDALGSGCRFGEFGGQMGGFNLTKSGAWSLVLHVGALGWFWGRILMFQ
ncbi:unnamed protein product, partial [Effrenium voratum]